MKILLSIASFLFISLIALSPIYACNLSDKCTACASKSCSDECTNAQSMCDTPEHIKENQAFCDQMKNITNCNLSK